MDVHTAGVIAAAAASVVVGWIGQHWLKADANFNTTIAHAVMGAIGFGIYALSNPFPGAPTEQWLIAGFTWAGSVIAAGSTLAGANLAAKTDSR